MQLQHSEYYYMEVLGVWDASRLDDRNTRAKSITMTRPRSEVKQEEQPVPYNKHPFTPCPFIVTLH